MTTAVAEEVKAGESHGAETQTRMKIGVPQEIYPGERRVAVTPDTAKRLQKLGFEVLVESGAGEKANFSDAAYQQAECQVVADASTLWAEADIVLKVRPPEMHPTLGKSETELLSEGGTLVSFIWPAQNQDLLNQLAARRATVLAMDAIPRITRAQKMDALSSMANIAGYRAVIEAANNFGRFFTGQITAAGKVPPAKVLIIGAGVAGLAAIGAARSLGAVVRAFDTRPVVKEQVESLGAEFLELSFADEDGTGEGGYAKVMSEEFIKAEMALFAEQAKEVDIIITTALIPGKPAPKLITQEMVESMKEGSVIVDMAAEQGGNCAVTKPGEIYRYQGVTIIGLTDLPSRMATQSSQLYGTNLFHLLDDMGGSDYRVDLEDEVVRGALILHAGQVTWPPPRRPSAPPAPPTPQKQESAPAPTHVKREVTIETDSLKPTPTQSNRGELLWPLLAGLALVGIGIGAPSSFLSHFTVFVLACFVGWQVIWNVKPALHTPLMSVTNAISGIIIVGGMLQISGSLTPTTILGAIAVLLGTINISGGFLVTQRMLKMFQK